MDQWEPLQYSEAIKESGRVEIEATDKMEPPSDAEIEKLFQEPPSKAVLGHSAPSLETTQAARTNKILGEIEAVRKNSLGLVEHQRVSKS